MSRDAALVALGLPIGADPHPDVVLHAYRTAVQANHPDHGGFGDRIETLQQARDALQSRSAISPCVLCRGVGKTKGRFGAQTCTACEGSGETK